MSQKKEPKPGLLCEDADGVEVQNEKTGEQFVVKTGDRAKTTKKLSESTGPLKPIHVQPPRESTL